MGRVFFDTRKNIVDITAATTILPGDSGNVFMINQGAAYAITLPAPADAQRGWNAEFIVGTVAANAQTITCVGTDLLMKLTAQDLRELNILKYYRLTRKWVCKTYGLNDADLELLIYLDCKGRFTRQGFIDGSYTMSWDKNRWERLKRDGWIETWRHRNRTTIMYSIFKTSFKCSQIISRIYRILLGEEDLPTSERSVFYNNKSYTDKVYNKAIDDMIKDKER
jgi:hypothetical protein